MKKIRIFRFFSFFVGFFAPMAVLATTIGDTQLVTITGPQGGGNTGRSVASGDFNGDGYDDLAIGAHASGGSFSGVIYVVYGRSSTISSFTIDTTSNAAGFTGVSNGDSTGIAVATGDLDADGFDDIVIGSSKDDGAASDAGAIYVIYGQSTVLTSSTLANYIKFNGKTANDQAGSAVAVGDVNGDGKKDIIVAAKNDDTNGSNAGAVYIIYATSSKFSGENSLGSSNVIALPGATAGNKVGDALATGDINNDTYDDIIIGALSLPEAGGPGTGVGGFYVIYGQSSNILSGSLQGKTLYTGEAANDSLGATLITGDLNGDSYDDIIAVSPTNDDGGTDGGAMYVVYGQSATLNGGSVSTLPEFTDATASDADSFSLATGDINKDGYADIILGDGNMGAGSGNMGAAYLVSGQASTLTGGALATNNSITFSSSTADNVFGRSAAVADLNGDTFPEIVIGATQQSNNAGAVFVAYLSIDADSDGVLGAGGLVAGSDCNDSDATVSVNQTFYADADADGLGAAASTTTACSLTAPTGYVTNDDDTNDTIVNNGVEIGGDSVDNDGDSAVDEANTITENGAHPYYSTLDATDTDVIATAITSIEAGDTTGTINVTYADNSVYVYTVFTATGSRPTKLSQYNNTGYAVAMLPNAKKAALVNLLTGAVEKTVTLTNKPQGQASLKFLNVKRDNSLDVVITAKNKKQITVVLLQVNTATPSLQLKDSTTITNNLVAVVKTKASKRGVVLRSKKGRILQVLPVSKKYQFVPTTPVSIKKYR